MLRTTSIILRKPEAPLSLEAKARPLPARHWRNWRGSGVALSAVLHVLVVGALTLSVPVFGRPAPPEPAIPVEVVPRVPAKAPEEPKPEKSSAPEEPGKAEEPKPTPVPKPMAQPEPPKPAATPPVPALKPAPEAATPQFEAARPVPAPASPPPAPAPTPPPAPPEASLPPVPPPAPEAEQPKGPTARLKVDADEVPPPSERTALAYWVLEPLTVDLRNRCGMARITGVMELREQVAEGRYRGLIRTRIAWARCPAEGAIHAVELRFKGGEVQLLDADGTIDRGAVRGNTMMLEDAYGRSVWKKR